MAAFRILVVCTGNICRSPIGQSLLTHRLRERLGRDVADAAFEVTSAGTYGLTGHPIEPDAMAVLSSYGVVPEPFAARELTAELVEGADLVLGATREHRAAAVTLVPRASTRTFTIRELARLAAAVDPGVLDPPDATGSGSPAAEAERVAARARCLVAAAAGNRGLVRAPSAGDDDVADPYRRSFDAFTAAGREISAAVDAIVATLTPHPPR